MGMGKPNMGLDFKCYSRYTAHAQCKFCQSIWRFLGPPHIYV